MNSQNVDTPWFATTISELSLFISTTATDYGVKPVPVE